MFQKLSKATDYRPQKKIKLIKTKLLYFLMHNRILQAIYHSFTMIYIYNGDTCNNYMIRFMINYMRNKNKVSYERVVNFA